MLIKKLRHVLPVLAILLLAACGSAEDRAQGHYERGAKLLAQQDFVRASIEFRNAVRLKKNLVAAWRGLAQIEERNRNWGALNATLRTIVDLDPKDADSRLSLGKLLLLSNSLDEALTLANAAHALDSKNPAILAFKAAVLLRLNDNAGAVREAKLALALDPVHVDATLVLAAERRSSGDLEGALRLLDSGPVGDIKNLSVQIFKIGILGQLKDLPQIEALLKKLSEFYPQQIVFRQQLVRLYLSEKRTADAEKELRAIASASPTNTEAGLDVVRLLGAVQGAAAAETELLALIKAGQGSEAVRYQIALAELKLAQGNAAESIKLLEGLAASTKSRDDVLTVQTRLAEIYLGRRQLDEADKVISGMIRTDSRNTNALRLRALLQLERGNLESAVSDLRQALNDQPRSTDLMVLLASAYERSGSIELAERQFADATRASNYDATVGMNYVSFLRRRGNVAHAEEVLTEMLSRRANNVAVLSALAEVRLQRQNFAGAQQIADLIRKVSSDWGHVADQILGAALSGQKRFDESVAAVESAYSAAIPGATQPMAALVGAYVRAKQIDKAVAMLRSVLRENPQNAEAHVLLGNIQLIQNAPGEALKSFQAAIAQRPQNVVGYRALADFYLRQNKTDEALAAIQAGLKQVSDSAPLRLALAGVLELKRDFEGAIAEYEILVKAQPGSMVFANNLASLLAEHRSDKASLDRAMALAASLRKSQVPHFMDTLGWVYFRQGNAKSAVPLLEQAVAELPNIALVRYHLGRSYLALNERAKATEQLKRALELAAADDELAKKVRAALRELET
jgi:cellulose synthase operon protein C